MLTGARESALLPVYAQLPVRPVRGEGSWLIDEAGQRWLDAYGGHAVAATGHCHPKVVAAIRAQAESLLFYATALPLPIGEQRATALMLSGEADGALTLWRELDLKANAAHRAAMLVCETLAGRPVTSVTSGMAPAVNQEFINWYRRLLGVNAERLVAVLHQRIDRWRAAVPAAARMIEAAISEVNVVPLK